MIHDADSPNGRDRTVEEELAVVKVDVSAEIALQQLHESKSGGDDHLKDVIGRVADQLARRGFKIEHSAQERGSRDEELGEVVAPWIGG